MEIKTIDPDKVTTSKKEFTVEKNDSPTTRQNKINYVFIGLVVLFLVLGSYSAIIFKTSRLSGGKMASADMSGIQTEIPDTGVKVGDIFGSTNEEAFNTSATGVLDKGGLNGEGTHKLLRPGGSSQTVYLTSSVIDLDQLVGDQVTIWGETFKGQKTGWLMDVGRAKVETLNAPLPE